MLQIEYVPTDSLRESPHNARKHSREQIKKIAVSITEFGFLTAIVADQSGMILAGHGRYAAARHLRLKTVPIVRVSTLTEAQRRAFMIADNKLGDLSSFDVKQLGLEFQYLANFETDYKVELTGFEAVEIDRILGLDQSADEEKVIELPAADAQAVSMINDLWSVGEHRVICANSLGRTIIDRLFDGKRASMVFMDPPYNVPIAGNVSGLGAKVHQDFAMACGEMSRAQFTYEFLRPTFEIARDYSNPGTVAYVAMDWRHARDVEVAAEGVFHEHKNTICWVKPNAGMGTCYRSQHEFILVFAVHQGPIRNNFRLGGKGRHRSNVWQYPGVSSFGKGRMESLSSHPTVKPLKMVTDAVLDCSAPGDIVFDPYLGSGTTALAAAVANRRGYGCEIDPLYCDLTLQRLMEGTGLPAIHASGATFTELAAARGVTPSASGA